MKKFTKSFVFSYVVIYSLLFPFEFIPYLDILNNWINIPIEKLSELLWTNVSFNEDLFVPEEIHLSDSYSNFLHWFTKIIVSFLVSIPLTYIKFSDETLRNTKAFFYVYIRYFLATYMLTYGLAKSFLIQFTSLTLSSYLIPIGEYTPYELLWAFMEISEPYQVIGGILEVFGGILLFARRTVLLGALVIFGVMANVFMFNLFYGLPVKIISLNYLLFSVVLIFYNIEGIVRFILSANTTNSKKYPSFDFRIHYPKISLSLKTLLIAYLLYFTVNNAYSQWDFIESNKNTVVLSGIFKIESANKNGLDISDFISEGKNLKYIIFERTVYGDDLMEIHNYKGQRSYYYCDIDEELNLIEWKSKKDETNFISFAYEKDGDRILIKGIWGSDTLTYAGTEVKLNEFELSQSKINFIRQE